MPSKRSRVAGAITLILWLVTHAPAVGAQGVELMPFSGYRFGGDFFEQLRG